MMKIIKNILLTKKLKSDNYRWMLEPYQGDEVIVLDTETTGMDPKKDEVISIGAVKVTGNRILINKAFEAWMEPKGEISEESIKIHGIRKMDIESAGEPEEVIVKLLDFIGNRPLVGYYIRFDKKMLDRYVKQITGIELQNPLIELSDMYYKRYRKQSAHEFVDLKFDTIMKYLDLPNLGKHDALNDAIMSAMIYLKLKEIPEYKGAFS